ncbi:peroxidase 20-like [Vigna radiata var. radiata]|uniref:peroxidase n=1 Tax=Vigna radiata var. radiata TaxID=3916 RepID=A0A1S3T8H9_VIGRR|nr:peroxidase 20-like [Vigna radiata var. radiata]
MDLFFYRVFGSGRKDSLKSSFSGANLFILAPNSSLEVLIDNFKQQGLDIEDLVTLSDNHTIGRVRCLNFGQRMYEAEDEYHYVNDRYKRYTTFRRILRFICPVEVEGRDNKFAPLDLQTPKRFDNQYFINILGGNGLLGSDNVLISQDLDGKSTEHVWFRINGSCPTITCTSPPAYRSSLSLKNFPM